ncbi:TVP38/TMEM64 family protein [Paenibacillus agaridevorans]|uniref:TVP38/TMEM64 family membrane protein n=1 Tax=Paenibacillus agaridevorans TaxID=171404 RepID=A0A2R5ELJ8_9BACL|nr:TVP38/TMEM64 family protein [Paenibacillus agaridevorans]GBG07536.1 TVP38/TMEM64 family protein [Paenibacillus agaridevorans]
MIKKGLVIAAYAASVALLLLYREPIMHWLQEDSASHHVLLIGAAILFGLVPIVPYGIVAGIIGAKYGPYWGGLANVLSSTAAAAIMFYLVRFAFHEQGSRLLSKNPTIGKFTVQVERNAFIAVLFARLLPFVPAILVNVYVALSRMPFRIFAVATLIGKLPTMFVFALVGDQWMSSTGGAIRVIVFYMLFLLVILAAYRRFR